MKIALSTACLASIFAYLWLAQSPRDSRTTIHLAGDSTMAVQLASRRPLTGWGEPFEQFICDGVNVVNHARNGSSTRSFFIEGLWGKLLHRLNPGDWVLIQFGHNDQKSSSRLYASPWRDYKNYLQRFINEVREHDAKPVLLTSVARRAFGSDGQLVPTHGSYPEVVKTVADEQNVPLIDSNAITRHLLLERGVEHSKNLYLHLPANLHVNYIEGLQDDTHLSEHGASTIARLIAVELDAIDMQWICLDN